MGSGKSTVGPRVAARLGLTFIDLDRLIRAHDGRSIPRIFAEDGEDAFRDLEATALGAVTERTDLVVALGGGALVNSDNRALARETGRIVYLEVDAPTIVNRIADEADRRPLLQDGEGQPLPEAEMRERIEKMLDDRRATYEQAEHTVNACRSVDEVVTDVVAAVTGGQEGVD